MNQATKSARCGNCRWGETEPIDGGLVCVNAESPFCAELWRREDDVCDLWADKEED